MEIIMDLKNYIKVYDIIEKEDLKKIFEEINLFDFWYNHAWYTYDQKKVKGKKDFKCIYSNDIMYSNSYLFQKMNEYIFIAMQKYMDDIEDVKVDKTSFFRLNKFETGSSMKCHWDAISDIFDGTSKGVPIFTISGVLNDNFCGGDLVFDIGGEKYTQKLIPGQILCFPSSFPWRHYVDKVTSNLLQLHHLCSQ